jgi:hypothetical protein
VNSNESFPKKPELAGEAISPQARVRRREGVVLRHVAGEHMLVPAVTREVNLDCLFMLNATGVFVWEHLDGRQRVQDLCETVAKAFSTSLDAACADVVAFLSGLFKQNLAERA